MKIVNVNGSSLLTLDGNSVLRVLCTSGSIKINSISLKMNKPYYYKSDVNAVGKGTVKVY